MAGRREKGTGSIFYVENEKKWVAEVNLTDKKGKKQVKRFTSKKKNGKNIVKEKMQQYQRQLMLQTDAASGLDVTFRKYGEYWRLNVYKDSVKDSSFIAKTHTLENYVYPAIGDMQIGAIETSDVQTMIGDMNKNGYSYSTIKKAYEATNAIMRYYRSVTKTLYNPCEHVVLPKAKERPRADVRYFNEEEREKIIKECIRCNSTGSRVYSYGDAYIILMFTGMRIGEFLALTWNDVDLENRLIHINKTAGSASVNKDGSMRYVMTANATPKTDKSNRVIPMSEIVYKCFLALKKSFGKTGHVIATSTGNYVYHGHMNERFHNILTRTGLYIKSQNRDRNEALNGVHTLRHTFASMLFNNGCSVKVVSELLGHSSTKITEDTYIHIINEVKASAIMDIDKFSKSESALAIIDEK